VRLRIHGGDPHSESQVHVVLGVPAGVVNKGLVSGLLAEQVPLRQGRSLVRPLNLGADEDHPTGEPVRA
jgi:hypothetical protein